MKIKPIVASLVMLGLAAPVFAKGSLLSQQAVIDQNSAVSPVCSNGWFDRISVGGTGSFAAVIGNRDPAGLFSQVSSKDRNTSDLYVNNLNLLVGAKLSSWSKANLNLAYFGFPNYRGDKNGAHKHNAVVDEGYVTVGDLAKYPFYIVAGKKYIPFGDYADPYIPDVVKSPTQMFAQTNAPTVIAGVSHNSGLYGNLFAFRGETSSEGSSTNIRNFGGKIGYYTHLDGFNVPNAHVNFAMSYLRNMWDTMALSSNTNPQEGSLYNTTKEDSIGGISVHGDLAYKAFSMSANFVTALKKMAEENNANYKDSKLWAADVNADYAFKTLERDSHLGAGVQWTGNGKWFSDLYLQKTIPQWRLFGEYKINLFKNTDLDLIVAHGKGYRFSTMTEDPKTTVGLARLMFQM